MDCVCKWKSQTSLLARFETGSVVDSNCTVGLLSGPRREWKIKAREREFPLLETDAWFRQFVFLFISFRRTLEWAALVPWHGALEEYSLQDTNVNTPFFQVPMLVFGHGASTRIQGQDLVLVYKSGHRVPLCTLFLQVMGQSNALYSLLSSRFKMASDVANWSNYVRSRISDTQVAKTTPFCAGTQEPVPGLFW